MKIRFPQKSNARGEYERIEIEDEKTYTVRRKKKDRFVLEHRLREGKRAYGYPHHDWVVHSQHSSLDEARRTKEHLEKHWAWGKFEYRIVG